MTRQQELQGKIAAVRAEVERIKRSPYDRREFGRSVERRGTTQSEDILHPVAGHPAFIRRGSYSAHVEEFEGLTGSEVTGSD